MSLRYGADFRRSRLVFFSGSEAAVPFDGVGEEGAATEQTAAEDRQGGGGQGEESEQEVHAAGTAQDHQARVGAGEGRQGLGGGEVQGEDRLL